MDATIVYVMMVACGLLMAMLPFGVFMGIATLVGTPASDPRILVVYMLAAVVLAYATSFGAFTLVQHQSCNGKKDMKRIASNAGISTIIQAVVLVLTWLIPSISGIVTKVLPPDIDPAIQTSVGYSYYGFWASLFGTAIGGTLSGICL